MVQPYLMRRAKVIKQAQLLDKDPAKLSCMVSGMPLLGLISACYVPGGLLIFVYFGISD